MRGIIAHFIADEKVSNYRKWTMFQCTFKIRQQKLTQRDSVDGTVRFG